MPDEDRVVAAIMDLTNQVSRLAWATEVHVLGPAAVVGDADEYEQVACSRCLSRLVPIKADKCPSCYEPTKEKPDG